MITNLHATQLVGEAILNMGVGPATEIGLYLVLIISVCCFAGWLFERSRAKKIKAFYENQSMQVIQ